MSKISLKPNSAGTANFEIAAPATNTDRTFTLPDEAGTVVTTATDLEPQVKDSLNATGTAPIYACRAFVNFDGTNTTIRDSGNVSSITDIGTGLYRCNFATAMPDANYTIAGFAQDSSMGSGTAGTVVVGYADTNFQISGSFSFQTIKSENADQREEEIVMLTVFR